MESSNFKEQHVLVTGGTRGIGLEVSKLFAKAGAQVLLVYRNNESRAKEALTTLPNQGHQIIKCDVAHPQDVARLFEEIQTRLGQIDIVVNNAGIGFHHPIDNSNYEEWQRGWNEILATNLVGPSNVCYQAAQMMIKQGRGKIINVSSRGAFRGEPDQPAYGASKAGLNSMTQSLAHKLAPHGIFVGAVAPGFVATEMAYDRLQGASGAAIKSQSPMNRVATPEEVAQAVLLMASSNQWMTGGIFDVNGASYFRT